ncbi:hypothetical protein DE146DRAFT_630123 [Phaeosphaeria sp. MPI-PUGE-AT-0046c]|nr:hypothetical protein DE146DRAFT_630123 [Phaeosphaeria sp. MPI-PUGE-AT-0046c]
MQLKSIVVAAALSASVAANFVIVTIPDINIDFFNAKSQFNSLTAAAASRYAQVTASLPTSEISRAASAQLALNSFLATASLKDVPAKVTEIGAFETITNTPAWFSQLPSNLKSYYESQNAQAQSIVNEVAGNKASSAVSAAAGPKSTGAASHDKVVQYMGVGAAAAMAGVFAL